jgi:hypothetical protein
MVILPSIPPLSHVLVKLGNRKPLSGKKMEDPSLVSVVGVREGGTTP